MSTESPNAASVTAVVVPLQWSRAPMSTESGRVQVMNFKEQSSTFASAALKMPSE
jgi:hypothetical protein